MKTVLITVCICLLFLFLIMPLHPEQAAVAQEKTGGVGKKAPAKVKQVSGEVAAFDAMARTFTVKGKKGDVFIMTDDKTTVMVGKEKKDLADVKVGDRVTVKFTEADGKNTAKSIVVSAADVNENKEWERPPEPTPLQKVP